MVPSSFCGKLEWGYWNIFLEILPSWWLEHAARNIFYTSFRSERLRLIGFRRQILRLPSRVAVVVWRGFNENMFCGWVWVYWNASVGVNNRWCNASLRYFWNNYRSLLLKMMMHQNKVGVHSWHSMLYTLLCVGGWKKGLEFLDVVGGRARDFWMFYSSFLGCWVESLNEGQDEIFRTGLLLFVFGKLGCYAAFKLLTKAWINCGKICSLYGWVFRKSWQIKTIHKCLVCQKNMAPNKLHKINML